MIYFIRHGESEANVRKVYAGQRDNSLLTEKGRSQARDEGNKIKSLSLKIDKIISSPLTRANDTAKIVAEIIGYDKEILVDPRIIEYDMGSMSGKPMGHHVTSKMLVTSEGSENPTDFSKRVISFFDEYKSSNENILMVCHAGVGRMIETIRENKNVELFYDVPPFSNATVVALDWLK